MSFTVSFDTADHRLGLVFTGAGLVLLPWLGYLAATLPPAQAAAWVTLDTLEAAALLAAGTRLLRGDRRYRVPAGAAAVLLLTDACADLTTSTGQDLLVAAVMAVAVELPLAALCAVVSLSPATRPRTRPARTAPGGRPLRRARPA